MEKKLKDGQEGQEDLVHLRWSESRRKMKRVRRDTGHGIRISQMIQESFDYCQTKYHLIIQRYKLWQGIQGRKGRQNEEGQ